MDDTVTYDVIVWGASGFTGRLVAEYLFQTYGVNRELRWAMGGRSADKLNAVASELGLGAVPVVTADAKDRQSLDRLVRSARVICTTVGPYQKYGSALVAACAEAGTDYVDLSGEPAWMRLMIDQYGAAAAASGARIVHSCGFDSIPFDLGVYYLQREARNRRGAVFAHVKGRVKAAKGKASGGTVASMVTTIEAGGDDPSVRQVMVNPYGLAPDDQATRPRQPNDQKPYFDEDAQSWVAPFVMAVINSKTVHRSNMLMNYPYGEDFLYSEMMMAKSKGAASKIALATGLFAGALSFGPLRALLKKFILPSPGDGPTKAEREAGFYVLHFIGTDPNGEKMTAKVKGDCDPGYGSTSKMLGEAAICLALHTPKEEVKGGITTPAAAMGDALIDRLEERAGLSFSILETA
ncbi:MAG: saccharopine dehydrogenase NADP-binding domain-containing protein [Pseudomonadota bacterium]